MDFDFTAFSIDWAKQTGNSLVCKIDFTIHSYLKNGSDSLEKEKREWKIKKL